MALESFNAYHSYLKSIEPLNDAERGRLFTALLLYSSTGEAPDLRGNARFIFPTMKEQIDRDRARYDAKCAKNKANSAMRTVSNDIERYRTVSNDAKEKDKEKDKEKEKDKDKDKAGVKRASAFVPPTLEEVEEYCRERGNNVDAKKFWEYFTEGNWMDAKGQKVRNWKQKMLTWEKFGGGEKKPDKMRPSMDYGDTSDKQEKMKKMLAAMEAKHED